MQYRSTWVTQSVEHLTSAQVMISWFMRLSSMLGSVLTAEPGACLGFCVSLSLPLPHSYSVSIFQKMNKHFLKLLEKNLQHIGRAVEKSLLAKGQGGITSVR